jgi:hypothetical protein
MIQFYGHVGIHSELPLEALAGLLSSSVLGGIEFGDGEGVKDEIPAVCSKRTFLDLGLTLYGECNEYGLELWHESDSGIQEPEVNLSSYICAILNRIDGIDAFT